MPPKARATERLLKSAEQRRRAAPVSHGADAGAGSSSAGIGGASGGGGSAKAPAFLRVNSAALERFVAANSTRLLEALSTPE